AAAAHVEVELAVPKVPYRETITRKGEGQGKYKKQSGGRGQYGDCWLKFEPLHEGTGFQFEWAVVGWVIPTKYAPAIEKGLVEALEKGVLSRNKTVDLKATCYDGSYHDVDSSEMAFKVAASLAFKNVVPKCNPIILEPILKAIIIIPETYMGDVMGNLNSRRGRILGMSANGKKQRIEALVPMSEMFTYSRDLRSITHGAGVFETEFDHYERVPGEVQEKIIAETVHEKEEEE
ncbi:elongation factor G, partial [Candidatus Sumerlaeota bacterium]|nr:elongation factor G [Candidatus Sumerlaeota bacterium]